MWWILLPIVITISIIYAIWYYKLKKQAEPLALKKVNLNTRKWDIDFLNKKRALTDPIADKVIEEIIKNNERDQINRMFALINEPDEALPENIPLELRNYFKETETIPNWADPVLIKLGQEVFARNGVFISMLLSFKSLPECYTGAKGANVLHHTGRLNHAHGAHNAFGRRIAETSQFVILALSPGGLLPSGRGIRAAQKVRLIHAVIRYYLKKHQWDTSLYDEPINQEDMAGTLMSFSALIIEGLELLDVDLTIEEKEAYIHTWRVVGHFMGVDEDLLPNNLEEALRLGHAIIDHQKAESEQGKALMNALIEYNETSFPTKIHPNTLFKMYRFMIGDELCNLLGVPDTNDDDQQDFEDDFKGLVGTISDLNNSVMLSLMMKSISKLMLKAMVNFMDENRKINFYIPESLKKDWGIDN